MFLNVLIRLRQGFHLRFSGYGGQVGGQGVMIRGKFPAACCEGSQLFSRSYPVACCGVVDYESVLMVNVNCFYMPAGLWEIPDILD